MSPGNYTTHWSTSMYRDSNQVNFKLKFHSKLAIAYCVK